MVQKLAGFTFNHADQPDVLVPGVFTSTQLKTNFDSRAEQLRVTLNTAIDDMGIGNTPIYVTAPPYYASGSPITTTGSITAGQKTLTVPSTSSFIVNHGISIAGAGVAGALLVSTITNIVGLVVTIAAAAITTVTNATVGHNDTSAIKAAIAACKAAGGGKVVFPFGTYNISSTIFVPSNTWLEGIGYTSQILWTGTGTTAMIQNENFTTTYNENTADSDIQISNLRVTALGTILGASNTGINLGNVKRFDIHHNFVENAYSALISVVPGQRGFIHHNHVSGGNATSANNGISLDSGSYDIQVHDNIVKDIYDCGIGVHNNTADIVVANNTIINTVIGQGIDIAGAQRVTVNGNTITSPNSRGILVHDNLGYVCNFVTVSNNIIYTPATNDGISVIGGTNLVNNVSVTGNEIYINNTLGNGIQVSQNVKNVTVNGNTVLGQIATTIGVLFSQGGGLFPIYCNASDNILDTCLIGVALQTLPTNINVLDNNYKNCTTNYQASNAQYGTCNIEYQPEKPTLLTLQNAWVWQGTGVAQAQVWKDKFGNIYITGGIKSGSIVANITIAQLPAGYLPTKTTSYPVTVTGALGQVQIDNSGFIRAQNIPNNTSLDFGTIVIRIADLL